jgi:hypothetical protein
MILWGGGIEGPKIVPGQYKAQLKVGEEMQNVSFEIVPDPRAAATVEELKAQFDFLIVVRDKLTETHEHIELLRDVRSQIEQLEKRLKDEPKYAELVKLGQEIASKLSTVETQLYQTQNRSSQDPLNFPIRLNNRLSALVDVASTGDYSPTRQAIEVRGLLVKEIDGLLGELRSGLANDVARYNKLVRDSDVPAVFVTTPPANPEKANPEK